MYTNPHNIHTENVKRNPTRTLHIITSTNNGGVYILFYIFIQMVIESVGSSGISCARI